MSEQEKLTVREVLQRIREIPRENLTPQTFMAAVLRINLIKRVYISRPKNQSIEFGLVIALPPEEIGEPRRFISESINESFSYN